jgi:hypothetical protein
MSPATNLISTERWLSWLCTAWISIKKRRVGLTCATESVGVAVATSWAFTVKEIALINSIARNPIILFMIINLLAEWFNIAYLESACKLAKIL